MRWGAVFSIWVFACIAGQFALEWYSVPAGALMAFGLAVGWVSLIVLDRFKD